MTLYIKEISPSRREIKLTPSFKLDLTSEENILTNLQYQSFVRKAVLIRDTIPLFNYFLDSYQIYKNSDSLKITTINFEHPLFNDVFVKEVKNFEYPTTVLNYNHDLQGNAVLLFENKKAIASIRIIPSTP